MNAIVWLYRGETEKYKELLQEYLRYFRTTKEYLVGKNAKCVFSVIDGIEDFEEMKEALLFEIKEEKQVSSCQINRIENELFGNGIQNLHAAAIRQRLKQSEADIKAMSESETGRDQEES